MAESIVPNYKTLLVETEAKVTWIKLNRPDRLNALNGILLQELSDALDYLAKDDKTSVIIIKGNGRAFSAGYDLNPDEYSPIDRDIVDEHDMLEGYLRIFLKIWDHPKPVIAAVHGYCLAGATQLCVFCDITVVAADAKIGLPALPAGGGFITPLWTPLVGPKRAKQMSFVANSQISGETASEWGWANYAVPAQELDENVRDLAIEIAKIPSRILRMKKIAINRVWDAMGFRNIVPMGAETDALLHHSKEVQQVGNAIKTLGLKGAIAQFNAGELFDN
jgi:enoyl-CoA hydratase/carnithine racemase